VNDRAAFEAMGCEVAVAGADLAAVAAVFARYERACSPFRAASELTWTNASARDEVVVTPFFASVLRCALDAAAETEGLVDPTLAARADEVRLDGLVLRRPNGLVLDLNGVVKALAVDAAGQLVDRGFVSAGGDLVVRGPLDVALPAGGAVRVVRGGLATSGRGRDPDHLIDPRTGRPSRSRWRYVTVSGATCLAADVAAKAAFLLDDEGPEWLDARGLAGRFVAGDGATICNACWECAAGGVAACI
jgi:thiamine biosynthesis lipoprotein